MGQPTIAASPVVAPVPAPIAAPSPPLPADPATVAAALAYIKPPPTIAFPSIPKGFIPRSVAAYRSILPKKEELGYMPQVVEELGRFADYDEVFGKTAPSHAASTQTMTASYQWSALRQELADWQKYAQVQEAVSWIQARALISRLRPAYALAVAGDGGLATQYSNLGQLFGVSKAIAKRAVSTRQANKTEIAAGRAPYKGTVGKARKKKAEKQALVTQELAEGATGSTKAPSATSAASVPVNAASAASPAAAATPAVAPTAAGQGTATALPIAGAATGASSQSAVTAAPSQGAVVVVPPQVVSSSPPAAPSSPPPAAAPAAPVAAPEPAVVAATPHS